MGKLVSALEAVQCIADGDVVSAACSSGLNCPDAVLAAVGDRFARDGAPRGITMLQPIAAGDSMASRESRI